MPFKKQLKNFQMTFIRNSLKTLISCNVRDYSEAKTGKINSEFREKSKTCRVTMTFFMYQLGEAVIPS